ncbi:MAG: hypothetical protein IJO83_05895 [Clostridia bacterium]|nr:hypothetical protein [Clostridia bacterium]
MKRILSVILSLTIIFTTIFTANVASAAPGKYMHISFDDVYACLYDITVNQYSSVFENTFFAELRKLHGDYGAVFTLNCFNTSTKNSKYDISNLPDRYSDELAGCADWLRFAFHAESDTTAYGTTSFTNNIATPAQSAASYKKFTSAILNATGTADSVDTVVRLGFFTGTRENVEALRECDYGITGLLTADDTRLSYYFDNNLNNYIINNNDYYDGQLNLRLIRSQKRLEGVSNTSTALNTLSAYSGNMIEVFTHEQDYKGSVPNRLKEYIQWAKNQGYGFGFAMDVAGELMKISYKSVSKNTETYSLKVNASDVTVFAGVYNKEGALTRFTKVVPENNTASVTLSSSTDTKKVKFMLWSAWENMKPLSLAVSSE